MVNAFMNAKRTLQFYSPMQQLFALDYAINSLINDKKMSDTQGKYSRIQQLKKLRDEVLSRIKTLYYIHLAH